MKKHKQHERRRKISKTLIYILGGILGLLILVFVFRGWIRITVEPKTVSVFYKSNVKKVRDDEAAKLGDPFKALGYSSLQNDTGSCTTDWARGIRTNIVCNYDQNTYQEVPKDQAYKDTLNANAAKLMDKLKQNGWEGQYTDNGEFTSLTKLIRNLTDGIDYTPDASYFKKIGPVECYIQTTTAFSKPEPPAMDTHLTCSRSIYIIGDPY